RQNVRENPHCNLLQDSNYSSVVYSGCYTNESERTVTLFDLEEFSFCIPNFTTPANISSNATFAIRGLGSASICKESLITVFSYNESESGNQLVCRQGPGNVCQPILNATNHFVATGLFFDIAKELNLPVEAAFSTFDGFEKAVKTSCEANSSSSSLNSIALETLCVRSMYTFLLLTESGYGLTNTTWNITFKNASSEKEKAVSSESYLVLKSGSFPDNNGVPPLKSSAYAHKTVLISFGIVFLIFGVLSVAVFNHQKKKKRRAAFSYHEFD
ncbi:uncharacterized protein LOC142357349, partial [Convolutriloba macropyga]|uniref:uncharacterized protein LOC142357349 n=1 Tax=Convolutriloba macropyga TaxID=536237 RepID=UPI003F524D25